MNTIYYEAKAEGNGRVVATDFTEDRDGERISVEGLDLKAYKKNPIMLFGHNHANLPIGKAKNLKIEGKRLTFEPVFSEATQFARDVKALWDEKVLRAVSIGFIPKERDKNVYTLSELLEISVVNVPANPNALAEAKSKGLNIDVLKEVPGRGNLDLFPEEKEWDAQAAVKRLRSWAGGDDKDTIDFDKYKQAFGYRDEENPKDFTSYKFPFADVDGDEIKAVPKGVFTAQAALLGASSGSVIPEDDKMKMHTLLGMYYRKMGKSQPEMKQYTIEEVIGLVKNASLLPLDGLELIAALHSARKETQVEAGKAKAVVDANAVLVDALHLALQQINKHAMKTLKTINDVQRKR